MRIGIEIKRHVSAVVEYRIEVAALFYGIFRHTALAEHRVSFQLVARAVRTPIARKFGAHGGTLFVRIRRNIILRKPGAVRALLLVLHNITHF